MAMRLLHTWIAVFIAVVCVAQDLPNDLGLVARQATTPSSDGNASSSTSLSATTRTSITFSPTTTQTVSTEDGSPTSVHSITPTSTVASTTSTIANTSATSDPTSTSNPDVLPIQPSITPAIGIAGVILIIEGLVLCFVGIKNRSIQIFLSTSLLVALSIEVLIIYVMNPPVSNAVQGGYLVAGVVGGGIIGGIAMIFKEVTEGLGCVLGGFSFAMWLLVLAPGGTIKSDSGRIILIAVFCVVCFSLSFSRYTRHYGIIACTSFAGATVFILGVDCFSRAGLKEFWLYVWGLNPAEFPLGTETYPFTRYIRVEVALNVIVAILGVLSQIKLWKIVRDRKVQRAAERLQDEENRDQIETEIGRDLEARNRRDRAHWEGTYGDKDATDVQVDSAIGSSIDGYSKNSTEVMEREIETIELSEFSDPTKRSSNRGSNPLVRIRPASIESKSEQRLIGTASNSESFVDSDFDQSRLEPQRSSQTLRGQPLMVGTNRESAGLHQRSSVNSGPVELDASSPVHQENRLSVEEEVPIQDRRGASLKRLSLTPGPLDEVDDAIHSPFEDDRASSIAATAAEDPDLDALSEAFNGSRAPTPYILNSTLNVETPLEEEDEEILQRPVRPALATSESASLATTSSVKESTVPGDEEDNASHTGPDTSPVGNLSEHLPRKLSRAASQYRTTEWAKEVGRAEPEPIEDLMEGTLDGVRVNMKSAAEAARAQENNASQNPQPKVDSLHEPEPEMERGVQQGSRPSTSIEAAPLHMPNATAPNRDSAQSLSRNPYHHSMNMSRQSLNAVSTPVYAHQNNASHVSLQRVGSSSSQLLALRQNSNSFQMPQTKPMGDGSRNMSAPLISQTLVESPAEDLSSPMDAQHRSSMAAGHPTLLDIREHKLKGRVTSTSFNAVSANPSIQNLAGQTDSHFTASDHGSGSGPFADGSLPDEFEEEMTLAERQVIVKEQVRRKSGSSVALPRPPSVRRLSQPNLPEWPLTTVLPPPLPTQQPQQLVRMNSNSQQLIYDSHQPRRISAFDQNKAGQNWSIWQSQKAVATTERTAMLTMNGQMDMLRQQRAQKDFEVRQRAEQQQAIQAQMDAHMRMGGMHDAHRNALSRMQNKANKHASVQGG